MHARTYGSRCHEPSPAAAPSPAHDRPRLIAPLAFILAVIAVGLVIVYTIGRFVESTLQAVPVG